MTPNSTVIHKKENKCRPRDGARDAAPRGLVGSGLSPKAPKCFGTRPAAAWPVLETGRIKAGGCLAGSRQERDVCSPSSGVGCWSSNLEAQGNL